MTASVYIRVVFRRVLGEGAASHGGRAEVLQATLEALTHSRKRKEEVWRGTVSPWGRATPTAGSGARRVRGADPAARTVCPPGSCPALQLVAGVIRDVAVHTSRLFTAAARGTPPVAALPAQPGAGAAPAGPRSPRCAPAAPGVPVPRPHRVPPRDTDPSLNAREIVVSG